MMTGRCTHSYQRRGFLRIGIAGTFGLSDWVMLRSFAQEGEHATTTSQAKADSVIMVWLAGGPATIDMWDMKPDAKTEIRGEFQPIPSSLDGLSVCEHLPKLAQVMHHCSLVRSCRHSLAAHEPGSRYLLSGNLPNAFLEHPSLGFIVTHELPASVGVPDLMTIGRPGGVGGGYLGPAYDPFDAPPLPLMGRDGDADGTTITLPDGFTMADLNRRGALLSQLDRFDAETSVVDDPGLQFRRKAFDILRSDKTRKALNLTEVDAKTRERYGRGAFGAQIIAARRLIEAGVRFVIVGMDGWDTHRDNFSSLRTQLLPQLDAGLSALIGDLHQSGRLDSTIVCCAGEFGRTPAVNSAGGRDHWSTAMSALFAGGPIKRGYVHGATSDAGHEVTESPCSPADIAATILDGLGIDPHAPLLTAAGRPVDAIELGKPIAALT